MWQDWAPVGGPGDRFSLTRIDGIAHLGVTNGVELSSSWIGTLRDGGEFEVQHRDLPASPLVMSAVGTEGLVVGGSVLQGQGMVPWVYGVSR